MADKTMRMKSPPHPGVFLREEIIEPHKLTVTEAAAALGVTRVALSNLLNGKTSLTPEMALRFEKAFGTSMESLVNMQVSFDIAQTRKKQDSILVTRYRKSKE